MTTQLQFIIIIIIIIIIHGLHLPGRTLTTEVTKQLRGMSTRPFTCGVKAAVTFG